MGARLLVRIITGWNCRRGKPGPADAVLETQKAPEA
jgi:hypothetical protein